MSIKTFKVLVLLLLFIGGVGPLSTLADDYTGTNFQVENPVIAPASYASSTNYQLQGVLAQPSSGESVATNFAVKAGFLYFPLVTTGTLSATPGDTTVALSWSGSTGFLGWTVGGYTIGKSLTAGGPYTYSSVGNMLSTTMGSLTNGTPYYFVVRTEDFFGNYIATSSEVTSTPLGSTTTIPPTGGGGGGGSPISYIPPLNKPLPECKEFADLNCDGYVDIVDFSIMYYWFDKSNPPQRVDLSKDGKVDIYDFSIMAYYWHEKPLK
jgi:hypothetical protein